MDTFRSATSLSLAEITLLAPANLSFIPPNLVSSPAALYSANMQALLESLTLSSTSSNAVLFSHIVASATSLRAFFYSSSSA